IARDGLTATGNDVRTGSAVDIFPEQVGLTLIYFFSSDRRLPCFRILAGNSADGQLPVLAQASFRSLLQHFAQLVEVDKPQPDARIKLVLVKQLIVVKKLLDDVRIGKNPQLTQLLLKHVHPLLYAISGFITKRILYRIPGLRRMGILKPLLFRPGNVGCDNLNLVSALKCGGERGELVVYLGTDGFVAYVSMDFICEIEGGSSLGQVDQQSL